MEYEDGYWHKLVLRTLKRMLINGKLSRSDAVPSIGSLYPEFYEFSRDPSKSKLENLENNQQEDMALKYFERVGVIQAEWEGVDPEAIEDSSIRIPDTRQGYNQKVLLHGLDINKFERELEKFGLGDVGIELTNAITPPSQKDITADGNLPSAKLEPRNYDPKTGILYLRGQLVQIVKQKNRHETKYEPMEGKVMRLLFNPVKSLDVGVSLRKIIGPNTLSGSDLSPKQRKNARNQIAAINDKVKEVYDGPKLIKISKLELYINPHYLQK